jgi:hypothetical protein
MNYVHSLHEFGHLGREPVLYHGKKTVSRYIIRIMADMELCDYATLASLLGH